MVESVITIGGKQYPYVEKELLQAELKFYPENPRVYSLLVVDDIIPEQNEIEEQLKKMEHVRTLRSTIEANGGLLDPLLVRAGDNIVLEGNSRLAAYRMLYKKDPLRWARIKCRILPQDISDDAIFTLLGQYHIVGRQDWNPFEQAGYLWRRVNSGKTDPKRLANEMGLSEKRTKQVIEIYDFMKRKNEVDPQRWSYYEEYFKSRSINHIRKEYPALDEAIVRDIKSGDISQAIEIRQKLEPITKISNPKKLKKIISSFIDGKLSLDECFQQAELTGVNNNILNTLLDVRKKLNQIGEQKDIDALSEEDEKKCRYEIRKISSRIKELDGRFSNQ